MLQSFSLITLVIVFIGCAKPIMPISDVPEIEVHWMIPEEGDGSITYVYTDDFALMFSNNGLLRINNTICKEATK